MDSFLKKTLDGEKFELVIDVNIFHKDVILKAAYNFLDKWYFFFGLDDSENIILQFSPKDGIDIPSETIIGEFSDELLAVYLRDRLEQDNKVIREAIVNKAINGPLDVNNFVTLDTENNVEQNQIDFDKDIDDILKEIENDPDLQIDEEEIEAILREIEEETQNASKPTISVNPESVGEAKNMFKNKKQ